MPLVVYLGTDIDSVCVLGHKNHAEYVTTFFVPDSLVDAYKSASNWSNWSSKIKGVSEGLSVTDFDFKLGGTFDLSDGTNVTAYYTANYMIYRNLSDASATYPTFNTDAYTSGLSKTNYILNNDWDTIDIGLKNRITNSSAMLTIKAMREVSGNNNIYIPSASEALEYFNNSSVNKAANTSYITSSISSGRLTVINSSSLAQSTTNPSNGYQMLVFVKNN